MGAATTIELKPWGSRAHNPAEAGSLVQIQPPQNLSCKFGKFQLREQRRFFRPNRCRETILGVHFNEMGRGIKVWAVVASLALVATLEFSCFGSGQMLNAGDSECCRQMGNMCGSKTMPSPQSCCKVRSQHGQPYISSAGHVRLYSAAMVAAVVTPLSAPLPSTIRSVPRFRELHSPPLGSPDTSSVLRI